MFRHYFMPLFGAMAFASAATAQAACEGAPTGHRLILNIYNMTSTRGNMTASLYPDIKSAFLVKDGALRVWRSPVTAPYTQMCIWIKAPATYAVAVYHDGNNNHKLDISLFGYSERVGFSNNPGVHFAQPSFESVRFRANPGDTILSIKLVTGK